MKMELRSEQDSRSIDFLLDICANLNIKSYIEIGCAQLGTIERFRKVFPSDGILLGIDSRDYPNWNDYLELVKETDYGCKNIFLSNQGLDHSAAIKFLKEKLGDNKVDFLFIDGDHSVLAVELDWNDFSPFVRKGGIIVFHDVDFFAVHRGELEGQGSGVKLLALEKLGYIVETIPGAIGMGYVKQRQ